MKKLLAFLLSALLALTVIGCGAKETLSEEEKKELGYKKYNDMGVEFKVDGVWKDYDDNISRSLIGDLENEDEPIFNGLDYSVLSNELLEEYYDVKDNVKDEKERRKRYEAIFSKIKPLFSYVIFRADKMPEEDKIAEHTEKKHNEKLAEYDKYVIYFCYDEYDDNDLSDESKTMYKALYDDIENVKKSTTTFEPITPQEAISSLKKLKFTLKNLEDEEIDSSEVFKENKVTMVNIWATFCGPCIREMPDLQKLHEELNEQGFGVFGIIGDTPDEDNEAAAKKIIETKGVKFINVIPDETIKSSLIGSIAGYPTSLFVDSEGKIVGKIVTGSRTKEEYQEIIMELMESLE
ncbi:TlpA family protein disulfide reductase [Vallitalea pronyensis]|uniref:TlpA family protein disulfide reductase n=1 Tax=Vallitalea pronyensis TaxID=1348613 RepID=A0A8J8MLN7_9FIRM|nr:TlpA disulfide reductase family protein [Vallitalea pronyensis]QUI23970.1 TlpA family protein disulfide reductase [Vallitalea pronyensis]